MQKLILVLILLFTSFFIGCNDITNEPKNENSAALKNDNHALRKLVYDTSPVFTWDQQEIDDEVYGKYYLSNSSYSFTYAGYNFNLTWSSAPAGNYYTTVTVDINVNNQYCTSNSWQHYVGSSVDEGWTGWFSFSYNGKTFLFNIYRDAFYWYVTRSQPYQVQVQVPVYSVDIPAGFSVSPSIHNNLNQAVSISWTPSTDTDVTGYEIYRKRYYLSNGQVSATSSSLVYTATSRNVSSWQDNPGWGTTNVHLGIGYYYKIRAVSSNLNMKSSFTLEEASNLEQYDDILP